MLALSLFFIALILVVHLVIFIIQRKGDNPNLVLKYSLWWYRIRRRYPHFDYLIWLIGDFLMDAGEVLKKGTPTILDAILDMAGPDAMVEEILRRNSLSAAANRRRALTKPCPRLGVGTCADTRTPAKRILQIFHGQADVLATAGSILTHSKVEQIAFLCEAHKLSVWLQIAPHTDCGALSLCGSDGSLGDRYPVIKARIANAGSLLGFDLLLENEEIRAAVLAGHRKFLLAHLDTRTEQLTLTHQLAVQGGQVVVKEARYEHIAFTPIWQRLKSQGPEQEDPVVSEC